MEEAGENQISYDDCRVMFENSPVPMFVYDLETLAILRVNKVAIQHYGYSQDEFLSMTACDIRPAEDAAEFLENVSELPQGLSAKQSVRHLKKDGSLMYVEVVSYRIVFDSRVAELVSVIDLTESKKAAEDLWLFRKCIDQSDDFIALVDPPTARFVFVNENALSSYGYSPEEMLGMRVIDLDVTLPDIDSWLSHVEEVKRRGTLVTEGLHRHKDGSTFPVEVNVKHAEVAGRKYMIAVARDISERKRTLSSLKETKEFLEAVIHASPIAVASLDIKGCVVLWNEAAEELFGWRQEELIGKEAPFVQEENAEEFQGLLNRAIAGEKLVVLDLTRRRKDGSPLDIRLFASPAHNADGAVTGIITMVEDITEQKLVDANLKNRIRQQAAVAQFGQIALAGEEISALLDDTVLLVADILGVEYCKVLELLPGGNEFMLVAGFGFKEGLIGHATVEVKSSQAGYTLRNNGPVLVEDFALETRFGISPLLKDNGVVSGMSVVIGHREKPYGTLCVHSVRKRRFTEDDKHFIEMVANTLAEAIVRRSTEDALFQARRDWEDIFDSLTDMITVHDQDFNIIRSNKAAQKLLRLPMLEMDKAKCYVHYHGTERPPEACPSCQTLKTGETATFEIFEPHLNMYVEIRSIPRFDKKGELNGLIHVARDISDRKKAEELRKRHLKRLESLHAIDMAISSSLDLRLTMNVILEQVTSQLGVDAADILSYNPVTKMLEYAVGRGFRTDGKRETRLRIGEGYAGSAALERRLVKIPQLDNAKGSPSHALIDEEGFVSAYYMPLIAKGEIKGVLEVFNRSIFDPGREWLDFLDSLATQSSIAIDNSVLFNGLQRSNIELSVAYDATIEGWSRALDYRDKETEGHSQRVTEMTLKIAQAIGVDEARMEYIRWGALLHDIGKLGVPDAILFKPGKLDDKEWETMKKHSTLAHDLLWPISFLRPAIDIPYCHHEKLDGTGYPRGLKGEQIPLAARIFSVVDIWDALRSDRPYRPAWPEEKTVNYLKDLAGKELDPEVVKLFLEEISDE